MIKRQQLVISKFGHANQLKQQQSELPSLQAGEVTVEVAAAGVNFADIMARQGLYPDAPPLPMVVGYEIAGTVTSVAKDVNSSWIGKRVFGLSGFGGYSSHLNIPVNQLFDIPEKLSFAEAASIPVAYSTAYSLVIAMGQLTEQETILIQNAGGGVGLAIIDIAKHIGATTIGTASTRKHDFLKERGLDHAIDYNKVNWRKEVACITNNKGVELITDPLGGKSWKHGYKSLRSTGRLGMFGISAATDSSWVGKLKLIKTAIDMPFFHPVSLMNDNRSAFGVNMGHMWHEVDKLRIWMDYIIAGVNEGWVRPYVDKEFSFADAAAAHQYIEDRKNIGKIVLIP
jgi:NADPH:quinone reductase-like Zn-dependent oxidoreductase